MSLAEPEVRRWTAEEYHRAAAAGAFGPEERLELLDGEIYRMSPQSSLHATACDLVEEALRRAVPSGFVVRTQKPLALGTVSEPEPDVAVVKGRIRDFAAAHPVTAELVVEVAESSIRHDLGPKAASYAAAGIPEYWVLLVADRVLVVHRDPDRGSRSYGTISRIPETGSVKPLLPAGPFPVAALLP
jgi:Uma2 family endonuclease